MRPYVPLLKRKCQKWKSTVHPIEPITKSSRLVAQASGTLGEYSAVATSPVSAVIKQQFRDGHDGHNYYYVGLLHEASLTAL